VKPPDLRVGNIDLGGRCLMRTTMLIASLLVAYPARAQVPDLSLAPASDSIRGEVLEFVTSYYETLSDRDWGRFADHFWPGATITTVWQPQGESTARVVVQTVPEFVEQAPLGPGSREIFEERMLAAEVRMTGDMAAVFARYAARFGDPGDVVDWEGIDFFSLLRHESEWRIVALSFVAER
jgi:hypothetical protein